MARSIASALSSQINAAELKPFYAVQMFFDSGVINFWTGYGEIDANDETWTGSGTVLGISNSNESADLTASGMVFTFNGLDPTFVAIALTENYRGRPIKVFFGCLGTNNKPVSDMYQLFYGRMDVMAISEDGKSATLTITAENVLIDLERARMRKYTDEEQRKRYPGDNSLEFVATLQDKQIAWGR